MVLTKSHRLLLVPCETFMFRILILLILVAPLSKGQFDDRLWLIQAGGAGPGAVFECSRGGVLLNTYPGPTLGSGGVCKDLLLGKVWVCDDGYWNGIGVPSGAIRAYGAGSGLTGTLPVPGARGIVQTSGGDLAILINPHPLQQSAVQVLSLAGATLQPPIPVGINAVELRAGPEGVLWTADRGSGTISRIVNGSVQAITPVTSSAVIDQLVMLPAGYLLVSFAGQSVAALLGPTGTTEVTLVLPEPAIRMAADCDASAVMIGQSGQAYRFHALTGTLTDQFPVFGSVFGQLIPDQGGHVWVEDIASQTVTCYGFGGVLVSSITMPYATNTRGDPLGLEWSSKALPGSDVDGDGVATSVEVERGSDALDGSDVPPSLYEVGGLGGVIPLAISAPGRGGDMFVLLASLSGTNPQALGADGFSAPYFRLSVFSDGLASFMFANQSVQQYLVNMPLGVLDAQGVAVSAFDLSPFAALPPGLVRIYCCAGIFGPSGLIERTTNPVCFDNLGNPCP